VARRVPNPPGWRVPEALMKAASGPMAEWLGTRRERGRQEVLGVAGVAEEVVKVG
jgi:hypothetical protein